MPDGDYTNQWDEGGDYHAGWDRNRWGGQAPPHPPGGGAGPATEKTSEDISFFVSPLVPFVGQEPEKTLGCWATAVTMLVCWREGAPHTIDSVMRRPEAKFYYDKYYDPNAKINDEEFSSFARAMGLTVVMPRNFSGKQLSEMLKTYGAVGFNTSEVAGSTVTHVVVLTAIFYDQDGVLRVQYHDPLAPPGNSDKTFDEFRVILENVGAVSTWIAVHYPKR